MLVSSCLNSETVGVGDVGGDAETSLLTQIASVDRFCFINEYIHLNTVQV